MRDFTNACRNWELHLHQEGAAPPCLYPGLAQRKGVRFVQHFR